MPAKRLRAVTAAVTLVSAVLFANKLWAAQTPKLPWPLSTAGAVITTVFSQHHRGIDISAPRGTPIRAFGPGVVISAVRGWNGGAGRMVKVKYDNDYVFFYYHLDTIRVSINDRVEAGTIIGTVGRTGNVFGRTGVHLHLVTKTQSGDWINPLTILDDRSKPKILAKTKRVSNKTPSKIAAQTPRRRKTHLPGPDLVEPTGGEVSWLFRKLLPDEIDEVAREFLVRGDRASESKEETLLVPPPPVAKPRPALPSPVVTPRPELPLVEAYPGWARLMDTLKSDEQVRSRQATDGEARLDALERSLKKAKQDLADLWEQARRIEEHVSSLEHP